MPPRDEQSLFDILTSAKLALAYVVDKTQADFIADNQCHDAVIRRIEIIGEAASRVSPPTKATLPQLDWRRIIGMRNIMIHQYDNVDLETVWEVVQIHLPKLIATLEAIFGQS